MSTDSTVVHLLAGGIGGTAGAVFTCPLEVVKTRLQSSVAHFSSSVVVTQKVTSIPPRSITSAAYTTCTTLPTPSVTVAQSSPRTTVGLFKCLTHIVQTEGARGLFRGLGANLVGVAPSRAIYFVSYAEAKKFWNSLLTPETPLVHILSAFCAGFTASTLSSPIWVIKTRLQLDQKRNGLRLTASQCSGQIYKEQGIRGFYKGLSASYYGIAETVIHFVIYEAIKAQLREMKRTCINDDTRNFMDFVEFMAAGATSKTIATCVAYPHEVVRTRLRQEGSKYRGFWQTIRTVAREEGRHGLYRGLVTQLIRQIPNTAIMMSTYEAVVYLFSRYSET